LALLAGQAIVGPVDLREDARLRPKISFVALNESLEGITARLGKATGVTLEVSPALRDRKAALVFRERPGAEAMRALSNALFLDWQADGRGYRLRMPEQTKHLEAAQKRFEDDWARKTLTARLARLASYGDRMRDDLTEIYASARRALENAKAGKGGKLKPEERVKLVQQVEDLENPLFSGLAYALTRQKAASILAAGGEIILSTESTSPESRIPIHIVSPMWSNGERRATLGSAVAVRYRADDGYLEARTATAYEGVRHLTTWTQRLSLAGLEAPPAGPLEQAMEAWAKEIDPSVFGKGIDSEKAPFPDGGYLAKAATLAEHLRYLSEVGDVPVVADGFRLPLSRSNAFEGKTVREYLAALRKESETHGVLENLGPLRAEEGWLMARHHRYWRLLTSEVPERFLGRLENRLIGGKDLTIDDYAWFASQLTEPQVWAFETLSRDEPRRVYRFSVEPFVRGVSFLRLWADLNDSQRRIARSESGLPFGQLSGRQLTHCKAVLQDSLWSGYNYAEALPLIFKGGIDPNGATIRLVEMPDQNNIGNIDSLVVTKDDLPELSGTKATRFQIELVFGPGMVAGYSFFPEKGRKRN
jgi:hypothetical protein